MRSAYAACHPPHISGFGPPPEPPALCVAYIYHITIQRGIPFVSLTIAVKGNSHNEHSDEAASCC